MVMMPSGSADSRAAQKAALAGVLYEKQTDAEVGELLAKLESADLGSLDAYQKVGGWRWSIHTPCNGGGRDRGVASYGGGWLAGRQAGR